MKKALVITSLTATLALTLGALAQQGNFILDNSSIPSVLAAGTPGTSYSGTFGMEVWVYLGGSIPAGLNLSPAPGSGLATYAAMQASGFVKEATYTNQQTAFPGTFSLGAVFLPHAHHGETVVVALAAWNGSAPSWSAMLAGANAATRAGVVVFEQPTTATVVNPDIPKPLAMDQDLVLTAVPAAPMPASRVRPAGNTNAAPRQAAPVRKAPS